MCVCVEPAPPRPVDATPGPATCWLSRRLPAIVPAGSGSCCGGVISPPGPPGRIVVVYRQPLGRQRRHGRLGRVGLPDNRAVALDVDEPARRKRPTRPASWRCSVCTFVAKPKAPKLQLVIIRSLLKGVEIDLQECLVQWHDTFFFFKGTWVILQWLRTTETGTIFEKN